MKDVDINIILMTLDLSRQGYANKPDDFSKGVVFALDSVINSLRDLKNAQTDESDCD